MKKLLAAILTLALLLCGAAFAEESSGGTQIHCEIVDGSYVIRIPVAEGDEGWKAEDMAQDDSVVKLGSAQLADGEFVVRYDPVGDGEIAVAVRHYDGIACDQAHTFDLLVKDGAVQECTGGSYTARPDADEIDPRLSGEWLEQETQFTQMTIARGEGQSWNVEIASPMTHGAYIFKATVFYDCDCDGFVYEDGRYWDVPITDSDEEVELGEAKVSGTSGILTFTGDSENLSLTWYDTQTPDQDVVFRPANADAEADGHRFAGIWNDDRVSVEIEERVEDYLVTVSGSNGADSSTAWVYVCRYDAETGRLVSTESASKYDYTFDAAGESEETLVYDDGAATFAIDAEGRLIWDDQVENAGEDRAFERATAEAVDSDECYVDDVSFWYDPASFEIAEDEKTGDGHRILLNGTNEAWGATRIQIDRSYAGDPVPTAESLSGEHGGIEVTQGEWKGFPDVRMYEETVDDMTRSCFIVPLSDGSLTVTIEISTIEDDETAMDRDDRISAVVDSLNLVETEAEESGLYTAEDMDAAKALITAEFDTWEGCEMHSLRYAGDTCDSEENIAWMNSLRDGKRYTQCIEFLADFHSPVEGGGAWEADTEYTDYQWWLAREEGGDWELITWGY